MRPTTRLRARLNRRDGLAVPGAGNALTARLIADLGFEAVYLSGAAIANLHLGKPDIGLVTLTELTDHVARIADAVELPLIVDADTGFGNAVNAGHAMRAVERAGAAAIQIEDQVFPKRCGHFSGKQVVGLAEAVQRVRAVADARRDPDFVIVARTDARAGLGLNAALERAAAFIEAGADVTFVEAPVSRAELERIARTLPVPQVANLVIGGHTPLLSVAELGALGFGMVLYANAALQGAIVGMRHALEAVKAGGDAAALQAVTADFAERQRLVDKAQYDALEKRYATEGDADVRPSAAAVA